MNNFKVLLVVGVLMVYLIGYLFLIQSQLKAGVSENQNVADQRQLQDQQAILQAISSLNTTKLSFEARVVNQD